MLYEYRRYEAMPGRLPDLHRRFQDVTLGLFRKHGIEQLGFWVSEIGTSNELHYILRWHDMADREAKWGSFAADPEWLAGRAESEGNGPLVARVVNQFWTPTPYSALR